MVEIALRVATHAPLLAAGATEHQRYSIPDAVLGSIPRPGIVLHDASRIITIGEHGVRGNGNSPPRADHPVMLVVGDSFVFGDGVSDDESWPAILERLSGGRVINAAVPGFGLDQAVLRAEQVAAVYAPDIIIVGFIPDDVLRCEMSYFSGRAKPYFDVDGSGLRLYPAPVPSPLVSALKRTLSVSVTMDVLFPRFMDWDGPEAMVVHHRGREVACRLMERLAVLGRARSASIVVVAQPERPTAAPEDLEIKNGVLTCAQASHLLTVDQFPFLESIPLAQRTQLFPRHMSPEGNRLVAAELARFLEHNIPARARVP